MRMPFGKYRGQRIANLPADYLEWLLEKPASDGRPSLPQAVIARWPHDHYGMDLGRLGE